LTWPYHWSLSLSMMSVMSGFSFTHIISFICSFLILSILDFLADLLSTSIYTNDFNRNIWCGFKKTLTWWIFVQNRVRPKSYRNVLLYWLCVAYLTNTF
jgi:phage-related holin